MQTVYLSLVKFFNGEYKVVVHENARLKSFEEEVLWLSPIQNEVFNDSLAAVDRKKLERAKHVRGTRVPRSAGGEGDMLPAQVILIFLFACLMFIHLLVS